MRKFENLEDGKRTAYEAGEYLYIWLDELRHTCRSDRAFQKQIAKHFEDPTGVYEYWQNEKRITEPNT